MFSCSHEPWRTVFDGSSPLPPLVHCAVPCRTDSRCVSRGSRPRALADLLLHYVRFRGPRGSWQGCRVLATCFARGPRPYRSAHAASDGGPSSDACCDAVAPGRGPGCCPPPRRDARLCSAACRAVRCAPFLQQQVNTRARHCRVQGVCVHVRACCGLPARRRGAPCGTACLRASRQTRALIGTRVRDTPTPPRVFPQTTKRSSCSKSSSVP